MALRLILAILLLLAQAMPVAWAAAAPMAGDAVTMAGIPRGCDRNCSCCPTDACPCARPTQPEQRPLTPTPRPTTTERWELPAPRVVGELAWGGIHTIHRSALPSEAGSHRPVADARFHAFIGVWLT